MTSLGCLRKIISADEVIKIEPALARVRSKIVGGDFTPSDESGDARVFTSELAKRCAEKGVEFRYHTDAQRLLPVGAGSQARIGGLEVIRPDGLFETIKADAYVISMGSFSAPFLKPLGISLMIYPVKGYSATFPVIKPDAAPYVSLIDVGAKLVYSRLGDRLRVGGTAEMNGYSRVLNEVRCNMLRDRAREIFPDSCNWDEPNFWTGLRPTTPTNRPYVGRTQFKNLFLNSGHGTLGWTMGCGSGRAIAEIVSGRRPEVDFNFCGMMN